jgi:hypothetical protein
MSKFGSNLDPSPRDDESIDRGEDSSEIESGELSFDDLPLTKPQRPDATPFVHELQKRVQAALHEPATEHDPDEDIEKIERWPRPVQFLCIMGGSALCWAVILTPFLLF